MSALASSLAMTSPPLTPTTIPRANGRRLDPNISFGDATRRFEPCAAQIRQLSDTPVSYDRSMELRKRIALIAHDNCKSDLVDWARYNRGTLERHELFGTGTTATLLTSDAPA